MRDYQSECIKTIEENFKLYDKQLIQLPTGAGKTWIFSEYLAKNSDRALIVCPSIELKEQILKTLKRFGISSVSTNLKDIRKNYIISAATLSYPENIKRINLKNFDHIVIDEAHHAQAPTYKNLIKSLVNSPKILGCTATPERLDGKCLLEIFERITYEKSIYEMIESGYLANLEAYRIKTGQNLSKRGMDFRQIELKKLDNDKRNSIISDCYFDNCINKKTLIFCLNIEHAEKLAYHFKEKGIAAACVHGKMNKKVREDILLKFKSGEITLVTNCQILTEGFDEPTIEALIITRPTSSKSLYCQMIGRGLRKTPTKDVCYLYELTDNNHKICTFNVACGKEPEFQKEYPQGIRLTELYKNIENITYENLEIVKEKICLFETNMNKIKGNAINLISSKFYDYPPTRYQKFCLDFYEIPFSQDVNFLEAAFLIWKHDLKEKYGFYRDERRQISC